MYLKTRILTSFAMTALLIACVSQAYAAHDYDLSDIKQLEQRIEEPVVKADMRFLASVYAGDFRFTHGDGQSHNKKQWLDLVAKREAKSRTISTTDVEAHRKVAVTAGLIR